MVWKKLERLSNLERSYKVGFFLGGVYFYSFSQALNYIFSCPLLWHYSATSIFLIRWYNKPLHLLWPHDISNLLMTLHHKTSHFNHRIWLPLRCSLQHCLFCSGKYWLRVWALEPDWVWILVLPPVSSVTMDKLLASLVTVSSSVKWEE